QHPLAALYPQDAPHHHRRHHSALAAGFPADGLLRVGIVVYHLRRGAQPVLYASLRRRQADRDRDRLSGLSRAPARRHTTYKLRTSVAFHFTCLPTRGFAMGFPFRGFALGLGAGLALSAALRQRRQSGLTQTRLNDYYKRRAAFYNLTDYLYLGQFPRVEMRKAL